MHWGRFEDQKTIWGLGATWDEQTFGDRPGHERLLFSDVYSLDYVDAGAKYGATLNDNADTLTFFLAAGVAWSGGFDSPATVGRVGTEMSFRSDMARESPLEAPNSGDRPDSSSANGGQTGPDFVVTQGGTAIVVPSGAMGPTLTANGKGFQFVGGRGGNGLSGNAADVRIMDPVVRAPISIRLAT